MDRRLLERGERWEARRRSRKNSGHVRSAGAPRRFLVQQSSEPPLGHPQRVCRPPEQPTGFPAGQSIKSLIFSCLPTWGSPINALSDAVAAAGGKRGYSSSAIGRREHQRPEPDPTILSAPDLSTSYRNSHSLTLCTRA